MNISGAPQERNQEATLYVGNLDPQVTEELLWELMVQMGPVHSVYIPRDRITNQHSGYGFVEFKHESDAEYAHRILHMIKLMGRPLKINRAAQDKKRVVDIGANVFVGNLDPSVDEKLLYDTFSAMGNIVQPIRIMQDQRTGTKRFTIISYDSFDSSDAAIRTMDNQWLGGRQIRVQYAFKKDSKKGERHGTQEERLLAANRPPSEQQQQQQQQYYQPYLMAQQQQQQSMMMGSGYSALQMPMPPPPPPPPM